MSDQATARPIAILLVEDNPADVELTREALADGQLHNELHHVVDGPRALAFLRQSAPYDEAPRPGLILLDLNLPGMSGQELFHIVRSDPALASIPIAVFTASGSERDILWSEDHEAAAYIRKPIDFDQMVRVVHGVSGLRLSIVELD
jgi:two-component system, chemotaxis family, response regulator Rcp1